MKWVIERGAASTEVQGRCIRQSALTVAKSAKSPSSPQRDALSTVRNALPSADPREGTEQRSRLYYTSKLLSAPPPFVVNTEELAKPT